MTRPDRVAYTDTSTWVLLGIVLIASVWHPFRAGWARTAAASAGLGLGTAIVLFLALVFVPHAFDHGVPAGQDTSTCPSFIDVGSQAWWAGIVILGLIWWFGVGVLKAAAVSIGRYERRHVAVITATAAATVVAFVADFMFAFWSFCP